MDGFLNTGFLLGLVGIAISLSLSMLDYFRNKQRSRVVLALVLMGSIVLVADAVLSEQSRQEQSLLDQAKSELLQAINRDVQHVRSVVEEISTRLANVALEEIGTELVAIKANMEASEGIEVLTFGKGSASKWSLYANWLANTHAAPNKAACLTMDFTAPHHYVVSMILAYILTSRETAAEIGNALKSGDVHNNFPSDSYLNKHGLQPKELD